MTLPKNLVAIIGAGPSGLSLAYYLFQKKIPFVIVDKALRPGASWSSMPNHLKLVSPPKANELPGGKKLGSCFSDRRMKGHEFSGYLEEIARPFSGNLLLGKQVQGVKKSDNGFTIEFETEALECRLIINATGYFSFPYIPEFKGKNGYLGRQLHFAEFKDVKSLNFDRPGRVLVVGKRISAGQLIEEFYRENWQIDVSIRSPIKFAPGGLLANLIFRFIPELETLILWLMGSRLTLDVRMEPDPVKKLIRQKKINIRAQIDRFAENEVYFLDGTSARYDVVAYATGFTGSLTHLTSLTNNEGMPAYENGKFECPIAKDIFFLGYDHLQNFRSRFLRGLRKDAKKLAGLIEQRWKELQ